MKKVATALYWTFGILAFLIGLALLSDFLFAGLAWIAISLMWLPPVRNLVYSKTSIELSPKQRSIVLFVLFAGSMFFVIDGSLREEDERVAAAQQKEVQEAAAQRQATKDDFAINSTQILSDIRSSIENGNFDKAIEVSSKYLLTNNEELVELNRQAKAAKLSDSYLVTDTFDIVASIQGSILKLSLDTDLPDDTVISVTVARSYWEKGNSEEYERPYFEQDSTVGKWRDIHHIDISPARWRQNLKDHQAEMSKYGLGYSVARISNDIGVRIVVPINGQTNPGFGDRNKNLEGKAVTERYGAKLVEGMSQLTHPL